MTNLIYLNNFFKIKTYYNKININLLYIILYFTMTSYVINKIKKQLETIDTLYKTNKQHELEVRMGELKNFFSSNLGSDVFKKIYDQFMIQDVSNEVIIDWIFNKKTTQSYISRDDYDLNQAKFMKKITYKNQFESLTDNFSFDQYNSEKNTEYDIIEYILKVKKSQATKDNFRFSYSMEYNIDTNKKSSDILHPSNKPFQSIRLKNRYSRQLNKYLRLDMTIVKSISPTQHKISEENEYIVEIEVTNIDNKIEMIKSLKDYIKKIRRVYFNKEKFLFNLGTMNPQTLEKKDLPYLKKYTYTVTDKADGERIFVIFFNKKIFFYNPKTQEIQYQIENPTKLEDTVIDGEYLKDLNRYMAFDLLMINYKDKRDRYLDERLRVLEQVSKEFSKIKDVDMQIKKFYKEDIFDNAKKIWENRKDMFEYNLDGLIFTPNEQLYTSDQQTIPVLKWKEALSIDVRVEYNHRQNFTYFHHSSKNISSKPWGLRPHRSIYNYPQYEEQIEKDIHWLRWTTTKKDIINNLSQLNLGRVTQNKKGMDIFSLGINGVPHSNSHIRPIFSKYDIIEYEYDFEANQWIAIRKRTFDKEKANAYKTVESVVKSVINYISLNELYELKHHNEENIGALYDLTRDDIKRKNWRKYNNYVKNRMYKEGSSRISNKNKYHLEFACGKLGDMNKLIKNGYKNILAIDSSKEELYGKHGAEERLIGLGFRQQGIYYIKDDIKFTLIWGDITKDIKSGEAALKEDEKEKLLKFFKDLPENWKGFDSISIMYAIHYLFGESSKEEKIWNTDKQKWEGFMENIKGLLRYNGLFFGTYLNGANLDNDTMKFIKDGDLMYEITPLLNKNVPKHISYDTFFRKKQINTHDIKNEVWGENVVISEPRINKNVLEMSTGHFGLKQLNDNTTFEQYYQDFEEDYNKTLSEDEKRLCFINNTFMFGYIDMEQIKLKVNDLLEINIYDTQKFIDYLSKNIEDGELDNKIKDLYKIIIN
jgi:hypothetical protein